MGTALCVALMYHGATPAKASCAQGGPGTQETPLDVTVTYLDAIEWPANRDELIGLSTLPRKGRSELIKGATT